MDTFQSINDRIKILRKRKGMSQSVLADLLGMSQSAISWSETPGSNIPDSTIKSICTILNANETWLRTGEGSIDDISVKVSIDDFVKEHNASKIELAILKSYFELDKETRYEIIEHFRNSLNQSEE